MTNSEIVKACSELLQNLASIQKVKDSSYTSSQDLERSLKGVVASSDPEDGLADTVSSLTKHVIEIFSLKNGQSDDYSAKLLEILANATRDHQIWRSWFGYQDGRSHPVALPFILDIARQVVNHLSQNKRAKDNQKNINNALRLIANCCADNNVNRKYFLEQDGMQPLVDLLAMQVGIDTVIPTIYNICNDYEDPDVGKQAEQTNTEISTNGSNVEEEPRVSLAALKLAAAYADHTDLTTFELLLASHETCSATRRSYLAELVEVAVSPITVNKSNVFGSVRVTPWSWQFKSRGTVHSTMKAAERLAQENSECQLHICRAILHLLTQDEVKNVLLTNPDSFRYTSSILTIVNLFANEAGLGDEEVDEYEDELKECRKQFLRMFYELTTMGGFADNIHKDKEIIPACTVGLSAEFWEWSELKLLAAPISEKIPKEGSEFQKVCFMIILAQLAVSTQLRTEFLNSSMLIGTIPNLIEHKNNPDLLYPAVVYISRLAMIPGKLTPMVDSLVLQGMRRLLVGKSLGLMVPYETVEAYRLILKGRPEYVVEYNRNLETGSIIKDMFQLFDRTIEAGTKLAVGEFFIELLRTIFPTAQDCQDLKSIQQNSPEFAFMQLLKDHKHDLGKVFAFVCAEAEPKNRRFQGWFGLGVLSVWQYGRLAIVEAIERKEFRDAMSQACQITDGPVPQNLKIMISKMQLCTEDDIPIMAWKHLKSAADNLGINFVLK